MYFMSTLALIFIHVFNKFHVLLTYVVGQPYEIKLKHVGDDLPPSASGKLIRVTLPPPPPFLANFLYYSPYFMKKVLNFVIFGCFLECCASYVPRATTAVHGTRIY